MQHTHKHTQPEGGGSFFAGTRTRETRPRNIRFSGEGRVKWFFFSDPAIRFTGISLDSTLGRKRYA